MAELSWAEERKVRIAPTIRPRPPIKEDGIIELSTTAHWWRQITPTPGPQRRPNHSNRKFRSRLKWKNRVFPGPLSPLTSLKTHTVIGSHPGRKRVFDHNRDSIAASIPAFTIRGAPTIVRWQRQAGGLGSNPSRGVLRFLNNKCL